MKNILSLVLCAAIIVISSCVPKEETQGIKPKKEVPVEKEKKNNADALIYTRTFDLLNLSAPGLETVKKYYSEGDFSSAAKSLLEYYRKRNSVINTNVNNKISLTNEMQNIANQATKEGGYRFYVRNYAESKNGKLPKFWSFLSEGKINWNFIPEGVKDKEWKFQKHRLQWVLPQAMAYAATKDEKYAKAWIEIYGDWIKTFPAPAEGEKNPTEWKGLQASMRLIDMLTVFEYYKYSENFTPEYLMLFLKSISDHVENISRHPYKEEKSNIILSQYKALFMAGVLMPEFKSSGDVLKRASESLSASITEQFNDDGVHNELDPSYHLGVVADFIDIYRLAKANNLSILGEDFIFPLLKASKFIMDIVYPNYTIENYNDTRCGSSFTKNVVLRNLSSYSALFPDDNDLLYTSTEGRKGTVPSADVRKYESSGYYMFRSAWKEDAMMLVLKNNYNPYNRWHCQPDNGTIALYNKGRRFLPDAGVFTYGGGKENNKLREDFRSTSVHNTMTKGTLTIDGKHMKGQFLGSGIENGVEYVVTSNDSYNDLSHRRTVFFVDKKFFVIVDEGYGTGDNIVANISFNLCAKKKNVEIDKNYGNFEYGAHTKFDDGNNMLFKTFVETTEGYKPVDGTNYYSDKINEKTQRRFYRVGIKKYANLAARFITVILPFGSPSEFKNINISAGFKDNEISPKGTFHKDGAKVEVEINGKKYNLSYKLN